MITDVLFFEHFIFMQLLVSDCNDLGKHHFHIHVFDIIMLFIKLLLSLREHPIRSLDLLRRQLYLTTLLIAIVKVQLS